MKSKGRLNVCIAALWLAAAIVAAGYFIGRRK
jgi:hypothetical protein